MHTQSSATKNTRVPKAWKELLQDASSAEKLLSIVRDGLNAMKELTVNEERITYPDYKVRHQYLVIALRLRGLL